MTAKRDLFNSVIEEVRNAHAPVANEKVSYFDMIDPNTELELDNGLTLESNLEAFADYTVRDAILVNAVEDEFFAYLLVSKIVNTCVKADEADNLTQNHLEALTTAAHVSAMWEQTKPAVMLITKVIPDYANRHKLTEPSLNGFNKRIIANEDFPYESCRKQLVRDLKDKAIGALDE